MKKIIFSTLVIALVQGLSAQTSFSSLEYVSNTRSTIPKSVARITTPAPKNTTEDGKHVVQKGETLSSIARAYNTSYQNIALLNNLTSETIKVGQVLIVPQKEEKTGNRETLPTKQRGLMYAKKTLTHTVQAGDDIYTIRDNYDVKLEDIRKLNGLAANVVNFNIGTEIVYKEVFEPINGEEAQGREVEVEEPKVEVEVEVETTPVELTPPPAKQPKSETPVAAIPKAETTIVEPMETAIAGERMESGSFIGIEDKTQQSPYYIYHKTLKYGTKVRLHIPGNAGYVEATVVNRLNAQRKEIIGLSPACYRLIGGREATSATITYLP